MPWLNSGSCRKKENAFKMMTLRSSLCRSVLWLFVLLHGCTFVQAAIPIHLSHFVKRGSIIFNGSVEEKAHYNLHPTLTSDRVKKLIEIDRFTGMVRLKSELDCTNLQLADLNPFYLYIEYSSSTSRHDAHGSLYDSLNVATFDSFHSLIPLAVYIHGGPCRPLHGKRKDLKFEESHTPRSATQKSQILVEFPEGTCWTHGENIINVLHLLPSAFVSLCHPYATSHGTQMLLIEGSSGNVTSGQDIQCLNGGSWKMKTELTISQHCLDKRRKTFAKMQEEIIPMEIQIRATQSGENSSQRALRRNRRQASDINRSPTFSPVQYYHSVPENEDAGYIIATITATDPDSGDNGRLTYSLVALRDGRSQNMFRIDPDTGTISTARVLDREEIDVHSFRIIAADHGNPSKQATALLDIQVEDRNDHVPEFEMPQYHVHIDENAGLAQVIEVHAVDDDSGSNGEVRYSILNPESPNNVFLINPRSGSIQVKESLDRETISSYFLKIQAKDAGTVPKSLNSTAEVIITVLDRNDNSPQFAASSYDVSVREDVDPYSNRITLISVVAQDPDEGHNAEIRYNMLGGNSQGKFSIDPISGDITLTASLDYEAASVYILTIRAQDSGRPMRSQTTSVVVSVEDVNDNVPRFPTTFYQRAVSEDVVPGFPVTRVQASDADSRRNAQVRYSFQNPPENLPFAIDAEAGQITITDELDREQMAQWDFVVVATDMGVPPLSSTVQISVVLADVNDNPPSFERSEYYAVVDEDVMMGTEVIRLTATDPDEENSISYQINSGNLRNRFSIKTLNNEGILSVSLPLDYRQESRFVLMVAASDNQYSSTCSVIVNVTDANTYRPVFDQSLYSVTIAEDVQPGTSIAKVHATDNDFGENARITYTLNDPQTVPQFEIEPNTGIIKTLQPLDRETRQSYTLYVTASDNGAESLMNTTEVEIYLTDVNDNAPVFSEPSYSAFILENKGVHSSVLPATDADYGCNDFQGWLKYGDYCYKLIYLSGEQPGNIFDISAECQRQGPQVDSIGIAYLADIQSKAENDFIAKVVGGGLRAWIGAFRIGPGFRWEASWSRGPRSNLTYTNWKRMEPNNKNARENCVEINRGQVGQWNDLLCMRRRPAICKYSISQWTSNQK